MRLFLPKTGFHSLTHATHIDIYHTPVLLVGLRAMRRSNQSSPAEHPEIVPIQILPFPLHRRIGKVRDVASKLSTKTTRAAALNYRDQVEKALKNHLRSRRVPESMYAGQLRAFWAAVENQLSTIKSRQ